MMTPETTELNPVRQWLVAALLCLAFAGCTTVPPFPEQIRGANVLQTSQVAFTEHDTWTSLWQLQALGANTVALVYFLHQAGPQSDRVAPADNVTEQQLRAAIKHAHRLGLAVAIKPQMLVDGSWAGAINPGNDDAWKRWFGNYRRAMLRLARLAQNERVAYLFIGTELSQAAERPEWTGLIADVRAVYRGHLSYAAHGIDEAGRFAHWSLLDSVAVSLYEPVTDRNGTVNAGKISRAIESLRLLGSRNRRPVLIAELGVPSARGADKKPWLVPAADAIPDPEMQARVLKSWLDGLRQPWVQGVLIWCWYSDPWAGGRKNPDFTVQNKPAARVLACQWKNGGECGPGNQLTSR
jgi:hypothetical protein